MFDKKNVAGATLAVSLAAMASSASAFPVSSIDSFTIQRNGTPWFIDQFSDSSPPPNAPNFIAGGAASYIMTGSMGPENVGGNGKLVLNGSGAVLTQDFLGPGQSLTQAALLSTNTDSSNTTNGLKIGHTFSVTALFDLTAPGANGRYGVRLTDQGFAGANDLVDLRIADIGGTSFIEFRDGDPSTAISASFFLPLDLNHDQIALMLDHPTAGNGTVFGRYEYFDAGIGQGVNSFAQTATIFEGESWIRARFNASENLVASVWEPSTHALLFAGLGMMGWITRRQKRA